MEGLWLQDRRITYRRDLPAPVPRERELLLEVRAAGICGTDLELLAGYAGFAGIPGHEFVATVLDGPSGWPGTRVVASINVGCGRCEYCARHMASHCANREVIGIRHRNGAFAEQLVVPVGNVYPVPDEISDEAAVLVEPLAAALEVAEQVRFTGEERVLIVGAGRLAQLIAQVLARIAGSVDVLVRNPARRAAFEPLAVTPVAAPGQGYDVVVECSGSPAGFETAMAAVRPRGTLVMKSTLTTPARSPLNEIVVNEIELIGSRCGPFEKALAFLEAGYLQTSHMKFERFPLAAHARAFGRARAPDVYKVLFQQE